MQSLRPLQSIFTFSADSPKGYLPSILVLLAVALASLPYAGAGADDIWIMLYAGESLGQAPWFLNYNGQAQEISSSVLGALLAWGASVMAPAGSEYAVWKIVAWLPAVMAAVVFFRVLASRIGMLAAIFWVAVLCCIPQWHYWAWGGLESGLFWLLSLLYVLALARLVCVSDTPSSICATLLAVALPLTRADALWAPLLLACAALCMRSGRSKAAWFPFFVSFLALLVFHLVRQQFTGYWLPSPTYAKASLSIESIRHGLDYLYQFHSGSPLHLALSLAVPLAAWAAFQLLLHMLRGGVPSLIHWVGATVLLVDLTTVLVGGDWMGYHRFAARSILLKVLLLGLLAPTGWKCFGNAVNSLGRPASVLLGMLVGVLSISGLTAGGGVERRGLYRFDSAIIDQPRVANGLEPFFRERNVPYQRDEMVLSGWIREQLPALVLQARERQQLPLIVASYQAGYFSRELRKRFSSDEVYFVDLAGLTDVRIGTLPGRRTPLGLWEGTHDWARSISLHKGALGTRLSRCQPDLVYVLFFDTEALSMMHEAGYRLSYRRTVEINGALHGATLFSRERRSSEPRCDLLP